ncbi:MAG: FtsW/RodA/SpoVE family cell cycle protein, partial [Cucumibacter sp.]
MFSRDRKTPLAEWWWTVDREMLAALFILMAVGIVMSFAASPAVAVRLGLDQWHFIVRHMLFAVPAVAVTIGASLLTARQARLAALVILLVSIGLLALTLLYGTEVNGSKRWVGFAGFSIQPSEFAKPAFAVIAAWLMAERMNRRDVPGHAIVVVLLAVIVGFLVVQPD